MENSELMVSSNTTDKELHLEFSNSVNSLLRRNLAMNKNVDTNIINKLAFDKVVNVSFMALNNKNCTVTRIIREEDKNHPCVVCIDDLEYKSCDNCQKNQS